MQTAVISKWEKVPGKGTCVHMNTEVWMLVCVCCGTVCLCWLAGHGGDGHSSLQVCVMVCAGMGLWEWGESVGDMSTVQGVCVCVSPCAGRVCVPQGVCRGV